MYPKPIQKLIDEGYDLRTYPYTSPALERGIKDSNGYHRYVVLLERYSDGNRYGIDHQARTVFVTRDPATIAQIDLCTAEE